jgi:hypothetical protein
VRVSAQETALGGVHQRRRGVAGATFGQRSRSTPGSVVLPRIFFLRERIFFDPTLGGYASDAPSGMFPGGVDGARCRRSQIGGGDLGPDRVFVKSFRVLVVSLKSHDVLSFSFRGLYVILYRPLE